MTENRYFPSPVIVGLRPNIAVQSLYRMAAFAFGLVALLYLVAEELLAEAHEKPETS